MSNLKRHISLFCFDEILHKVTTVFLNSQVFKITCIGMVDVHFYLYDFVTMLLQCEMIRLGFFVVTFGSVVNCRWQIIKIMVCISAIAAI